MEKKREERLDIIRIFSLICVVCVHFFLNSEFYEEIVYGNKMLIMCILRSFFIICVPMFITLTGYLMCKKELNSKYYKGIIKSLAIYIICSTIYFLFEKFYLNKSNNLFLNILSFRGTQYSWYLEMYIGLFLLIPFLNLIFNNLKDRKQANKLLVTLMFLIGVPSVINIKTKILPSWWTSIYPIFYYFLGAYLNKYEIKLSKEWNLVLLIVVVFLDGIFNFHMSFGSKFVMTTYNDYQSVIIMFITFLTFNLMLKIKFKNESKIRSYILKILSDACLGAYLISCIFDNIYYNKLKIIISNMQDRLIYAPIITLAVLLSSLIISITINLLYNAIRYVIKKVSIYRLKKER